MPTPSTRCACCCLPAPTAAGGWPSLGHRAFLPCNGCPPCRGQAVRGSRPVPLCLCCLVHCLFHRLKMGIMDCLTTMATRCGVCYAGHAVLCWCAVLRRAMLCTAALCNANNNRSAHTAANLAAHPARRLRRLSQCECLCSAYQMERIAWLGTAGLGSTPRQSCHHARRRHIQPAAPRSFCQPRLSSCSALAPDLAGAALPASPLPEAIQAAGAEVSKQPVPLPYAWCVLFGPHPCVSQGRRLCVRGPLLYVQEAVP